MQITPGATYESWPQIGYDPTAERLWVAYSNGEEHEAGDDRSVDMVFSDDQGETWSSPTAVIADVGTEWRSPALGYDLDGALLCWAANQTTDNEHMLMRLPPGGDAGDWAELATPSFSPWPTQIGGPVPVDGRLVCLANRAFPGGLVIALESDDNGETWTQETIFTQGGDGSGTHLVEWRGCALPGGRALFHGRGNDDIGVWQVTYDNGVWSTQEITNIDDAYDQPVWLSRRGGWIDCYYDSRTDGIIRRRSARLDDVWANPLAWPAPREVARGIVSMQNAGYVSVARSKGVDHLVWYSGRHVACAIRYAPIT